MKTNLHGGLKRVPLLSEATDQIFQTRAQPFLDYVANFSVFCNAMSYELWKARVADCLEVGKNRDFLLHVLLLSLIERDLKAWVKH